MTPKINLKEFETSFKAMQQKRQSRLSNYLGEQNYIENASGQTEIETEVNSTFGVSLKSSTLGRISEENSKNSISRIECSEKTSHSDFEVNKKCMEADSKTAFRIKPLNTFSGVSSNVDSFQKEIPTKVDNKKPEKANSTNNVRDDQQYMSKLSKRKPIHFSNDYIVDTGSAAASVISNDSIPSNLKGSTVSSNLQKCKDLNKESNTPMKSTPNTGVLKYVSGEHLQPMQINEISQTNKSYKLQEYRKQGNPLNDGKTFSKNEKILRKLHMHYLTMETFLKDAISVGEYDIDDDEMNDIKNTLSATKDFLVDYENKILQLDEKLPLRKFYKVKQDLEVIKKDILCYRGLRKDIAYTEIYRKIIFYEELLRKLPNAVKGRKELCDSALLCFKLLEMKVNNNEMMLSNLFTELVDMICLRKIKETYL